MAFCLSFSNLFIGRTAVAGSITHPMLISRKLRNVFADFGSFCVIEHISITHPLLISHKLRNVFADFGSFCVIERISITHPMLISRKLRNDFADFS